MWPLVTRHRFVRELRRQGEAYRQNLDRAEYAQRVAEGKLERERQQFVDQLDKLTWYRDEDGDHQLEPMYDEEPHNLLHLTIHRHHVMDCTMFHVKVTNFLLNRATKQLDQQELKFLYNQLSSELARQFFVRLIEGKVDV